MNAAAIILQGFCSFLFLLLDHNAAADEKFRRKLSVGSFEDFLTYTRLVEKSPAPHFATKPKVRECTRNHSSFVKAHYLLKSRAHVKAK